MPVHPPTTPGRRPLRGHEQTSSKLYSVSPVCPPQIAAIAATDGKWIIAAQDRNGLRPLRYTVTSDKFLFAGSETGMIRFPNEKIIFKGRLGPGQAIAIDLDKGQVYDSKSLKNKISKDYKKYNKQIIDLDKKFEIVKEEFIQRSSLYSR